MNDEKLKTAQQLRTKIQDLETELKRFVNLTTREPGRTFFAYGSKANYYDVTICIPESIVATVADLIQKQIRLELAAAQTTYDNM